MTAETAEGAHLTWPEPTQPLNQPRRGVVAAIEVVAAAGLVALALWLWNRGVVVTTPLAERPDLEFTEYAGDLVALSVASGTAAALTLLDAVRNLVLAVRARPKR
ncbi:hypothetical protein [Actinokineospora sp. UTMC 2448]|uniref:hypothetical protein n=1 Tax=Actinokineospora sp. UTMC 2448 TaxID=2268449 RepID=UPI0021645226|nr:hypothetical protein [Actinokineospora sp. UTMC 2448]UVS82294.1 hypothetical protein Actkin_06063 [Actinokineospora sp. UTMC 2448]